MPEQKAVDYISDINQGIEWREEVSGKNDKNWTRFSRYYTADWLKLSQSYGYDSGYIPANRGFSYIRAGVPQLYYKNPKVVITGVDPEFGQSLQKMDNLLFDRMLLKKHLKRCLLDAQITGVMILKFGYNSRFEVAEEGTVTKTKIEYARGVNPGMPWVGRVLPVNFVLPNGCMDIDEASWCAEYVIRPLEDVKQEKGYNQENIKKLKGSKERKASTTREVIRNFLMGINEGQQRGDELRRNGLVGLWHVWDKGSGELVIIDDSTQLELYSQEKPILEWGFPYIFKALNEHTRSVWAVSDMKILEPDLLDLGDAKSERRKLRRTMIYKFLVRTGTFTDQDALDKFFDANILRSAVMTNQDPNTSIKELQSQMPQHLYMEPQMIENEMQANLRFSRNRQGDFATGRRTATEAQNVNQSNLATDDERRDIIADGVSLLSEGLNFLLFTIWGSQDVTTNTGIQFPYWPDKPADVKLAALTYSVNGEDLQPPNTQLKRAEATAKYQLRRADPLFNPLIVASEHAYAWNESPREVLDPALGTILMYLTTTPGGAKLKEELFNEARAGLAEAEAGNA